MANMRKETSDSSFPQLGYNLKRKINNSSVYLQQREGVSQSF